MKVLILGGTGAMGEPLVEILHNIGYTIDVTSRFDHFENQRKGVRFIKGDGHNIEFLYELFGRERYNAIVDFLKYEPEDFKKRINILLDATDQYFFISSCRVYANSEVPIDETSLRLLDDEIDESEFSAEMYALTKAKEEDYLFKSERKNWTIIRPYLTYNNNRMQLGFYEKEQWLFRGLHKRTVLFPEQMLDKKTTLTYGLDVARIIAELIGNNKALGEDIQICTDEVHTWGEVIRLYSKMIKRIADVNLKIALIEDITEFYRFWPTALIKYDREYDRIFNGSKLENILSHSCQYYPMDEAIFQCLSRFIISPNWAGFNCEYETWCDRKMNERTPYRQIARKKDKLQYMKFYYKR